MPHTAAVIPQARSEATLYHDLMGRKTTSLSADLQVRIVGCVCLFVCAVRI